MPYELKAALGKVGPTPVKFGLYRGSNGVQVLITSGNPSEALLGDMLTQTGSKKPLFSGICFKEGNVYIFASKVGVDVMKPIVTAMKERANGSAYELRDLADDNGAASPSHTQQGVEGGPTQPPRQNVQGGPTQPPRQNVQGGPTQPPRQNVQGGPTQPPRQGVQGGPTQPPRQNVQGSPTQPPRQGVQGGPTQLPRQNVQGGPTQPPRQNVQGGPTQPPRQDVQGGPTQLPRQGVQGGPTQPPRQGVQGGPTQLPRQNVQGGPTQPPRQGVQGGPTQPPRQNVQGSPTQPPRQGVQGGPTQLPRQNVQGGPTQPPRQNVQGGPTQPPRQGVQGGPTQPPRQNVQGGPTQPPRQNVQGGPTQPPRQGVQGGPTQPPRQDVQGGPTQLPRQGVQGGPTQPPRQGVQGGPTQPPRQGVQGGPTQLPRQNVQGGPTQPPRQNVQGGPTQPPRQGVQGGPTQPPRQGVQGGPTQPPRQNVQGGPTQPPRQDVQGGPTQPPRQNVQGGPTQPPQQGVPQNRPAQSGPGQQQAPQRPNGPQIVGQRTATSLQNADVAASAVAQSAFKPGSAQTTTTRLAVSPVKSDHKGVANAATQFKKQGLDKAYIAEAKPNDKAKREAEVKAERDATAKMAKAMKKASGKKTTPKQLDELEAACQKGIECYSVRVNVGVKAAREKITRVIDDFELREGVAKAEGKVFDRAPLEEDLKAAKKELDDKIKGPEANRLAGAIDAKLEVQLRKNEKTVADLDVALKAAEGSKTEATAGKILELANQYRQVFTDHAAEYAKIPSRERPIPIVQQEALIDKIIEDAQATIFDLKKTRLGPPPWTPDKQAEGESLIDQGRELTAKNVMKSGTVYRPAGGTSEVMVLKNAQNKPAFAFKSAKGESSQMGLPPGGGAIREAVSSKVTDSILQQTGFDFGFPKSTIATIDGKVGALVEGLEGTLLPASNDIPDDKRASTAAFQNALPGKQLQKVMFAGLATGNFLDLKWDNVFFEGQGDQAVARPFDAGAAFLPSSTINYQMYTRRPGSPPPTIGSDLLSDAEGNPTKGATDPMDAELVQAMLNIDTKALEKVIDDEVQRHAASGLDKCLDVDSKKNGVKCMTALQTVLRAHQNDAQPPSLADVMKEVQVEIQKVFPKP